MTMVKRLNMRISLVLSLIVMMVAMGMQPAFAVTMPDLREEDGTLRIEIRYTDEDQVTNISGAELTIYKVADLKVNAGAAVYTLTEDFSAADVEVGGMTAAESIKAAGVFYGIVSEKQLQGKAATSRDGIADFGPVSHGMYLVVQTGGSDDASGYDSIDPYLVKVPQPMTEIGENTWSYDVLSIPKMVKGEYKPPEEKEVHGNYEPPVEESENSVRGDYEPALEVKDKSVRGDYESAKGKKADTGDHTGLYVWISLMMVALSVMILIAVLQRSRRKSTEKDQ